MLFGSVKSVLLGLLLWCVVGPAYAAVVQNIPLLDNRFRIDHQVESITLLIQRENRVKPVVVVQPDGSKWYSDRHPDNVRWSQTDSSDMIRIVGPTPGPWQLVGAIESGSQVRVLSGIELKHQPFPKDVYRGQRLKISAEIVGDGDRIVMRDFYQQLNWVVRLASENRTGDENFGSGPFDIGSYQDSGKGLDERPNDGVFAANLNFNYPAGLYNIAVKVHNDVFSRQSEQKIEILPQPVRLAVTTAEEEVPQLAITTNTDIVPSKLHLNLRLLTPEQTTIALNVTPDGFDYQLPLEMVEGYGSFYLDGEAIGTTVAGRDFYVVLPKLNFYITPPPPPPPSAEVIRARELADALAREQQAKSDVIFTVLAATGLMLLLCGLAFGGWVWRNNQLKQKVQQQMSEQDNVELTPDGVDLSMFAPKKTE
ncbi:TIGR03503 family protein [Ferrimonas lipolytica]|uniref:TIGR03503 family protein n=1 Tax=Ferrimonas lipolytica TaxID=2724191 RepID=A0A6H1UDX5_9GAMM|nr:TIGR03503 family protein [Ferrimonas lipolytica]QIZ76829.1 TIGR03503 family protein [Ferrimonas lipolytica]